MKGTPLKLRILLACCLLALPLSKHSLAEDINQEMRKAGTALTTLIPYIYNDERFRDPDNRTQINEQLDQLIASMSAEPGQKQYHAVIRQISRENLVSQLKQSRHLFNTGNYATAQYLLGSAPILCSSCHIQDGVKANTAPDLARDLFANDYSYGEFNYYIRNYTVAEQAFLKYLKRRDVKSQRISGGKTLERLLDITLISDGDLALTRQKLNNYRAIKGLDMELQQRIDQWLEGTARLTQPTPEQVSIEQQMTNEFGADFSLKHEFIFEESKRPLALAWREALQKELIDAEDKTIIARNLFLTSILERVLDDQGELSLANLYLKECVRLDVKDYSHRCLNEFESHLYFYYGGSDGENPPPEALAELRKLRKMMKKGI